MAAVTVFGLSEEVGGNPVGSSRAVGEDEDFAGAGEEIDGDLADELAFGFDDPGVARAEDFADVWDGGGAVGEGGDGLCSADAVDFACTAEVECGEEGRVDFSVRSAGGGGDDLRNGCSLGEGAGHDGRGDKGGGAARDVDADAVEGVEAFADLCSLGVFHGPVFAEAFFCEGEDVFARGFE